MQILEIFAPNFAFIALFNDFKLSNLVSKIFLVDRKCMHHFMHCECKLPNDSGTFPVPSQMVNYMNQ